MKVYEVNNNRNMKFSALRITKKNAKKSFCNLGRKAVDAIDLAGEIIKDTKFYHLYIDGDVYIRHISGKKLNGPYTLQDAERTLTIGYKEGLEQVKIRLNFDTVKEAQEVRDDIRGSATQIERSAKIVKYLDDSEKKMAENKTVEPIYPTDKYEQKMEKLIKKYGV